MMKWVLLGLLVVLATSVLSEDLISKYSLEVLAEGQEGTEPNKGD